ncbi:DUF3592 domain-containing protein [Amycolatopsis sp. NPDC047767]|uniref:DUF3592 domain-containing protein n=1 Tax=Amycolatopsis sp. NPDC047767 TaxID=3156765 RepID=UPI0034560218
MDLGTAGDSPDRQDDEPLRARTGRRPKPDPVTLDRAVRARLHRAVLAAVAWALVTAATIVGAILLLRWSDRLLVDGVRAPARVDSVMDDPPGRGNSPYFVVDYAGVRGVIFYHGSTSHHVGEVLTVYYDPADPLHVRTADNPNGDDLWAGGLMILTIVELAPLAWAVAYPVRLAQRRHLAARSGWRAVKVTPFYHTLILRPAGREPTTVKIVTALRPHYQFLTASAPTRGWVGGKNARLVLVVPRGENHYAIPVRATTQHTGNRS